jgi:hypothetical protein
MLMGASTRSSSKNLPLTCQAPPPRSNRQVRVFAFAARVCSALKSGSGSACSGIPTLPFPPPEASAPWSFCAGAEPILICTTITPGLSWLPVHVGFGGALVPSIA